MPPPGPPLQPPGPPLQPPPFQTPPPPPPSEPGFRGLTIAAVSSAVLAVLSIGAAAVIVVNPFGTDEVGAASDGDAPAGDENIDTEPEVEVTDLTEGLDPFEPSDDYYGVTWHDLVWVPNTLDSEWDVYYQEESRAVDWSTGTEADDRGYLSCGDTRNNTDIYPDTLEDPEAWYQAELDRDAEFDTEGDEYELVGDPTYTHYVIDGRDALLVEFEKHWTSSEDSEGVVEEVDWDARSAYLYIDLPTDAATADNPVTPARCQLLAVSPETARYEAGLEVLRGIRLWLE